jgi:hypothetical protein
MPMIICNDCCEDEYIAKRFFLGETAAERHDWYNWTAEQVLNHLVFQVSKKPTFLEAHVERIYYCLRHNFNEQLLGALVDLLLVLQGKGLMLAKRLIGCSKPRLTEEQFAALLGQLNKKELDNNIIFYNYYSVFSQGILSVTPLLQCLKDNEVKVSDPLTLARDCIEFSQLDHAVNILEQAILHQPEVKELHFELLSLYRSTRNVTGFNQMHEKLNAQQIPLPIEWRQLSAFFRQLNLND